MAKSQLNTEEQIASIWSLGGLTVVQLAKRVWTEIDHDDVLGRASELAYNFLMALFPLLLFLLALLGLFAGEGTQLRQQLFTALAQALPASASDLIAKTLSEITTSSGGGKLTFGALLFFWSATGGTLTMISVLNAAYHVRDSRPWYKVRAIALGLTLSISILVVLALALVLFGGHLADVIAAKVGLGAVVIATWKVLQWVAALFFMSLAFGLVYYFGPDVREQHWYWITPGSAVGVVLWFICSIGFRVYLHFFNTYSKTYGSLGAVIILLLWFYVTGLVFMVGGEINAAIENAAAERGHPEAKQEGEKVS